jgi:hypothetical protein
MPLRSGRWLTILWALLLGTGLVALAGSVLLPSTKRARVDWDQVRRMQEQAALADAAATRPATAPVTTTSPDDDPATTETPHDDTAAPTGEAP